MHHLGTAFVTNPDSHPYRPDAGPSFFADVAAARSGDGRAIERLVANERAAADRGYETRNGTTGAVIRHLHPAGLAAR